MIIAAIDKQPKYAVVKRFDEIVGVYSQQHQAVNHARSISRYNREATTCQWIPVDSLNAELRTLKAQIESKETQHTVERKIAESIRNWLLFGHGNYAVLNKDGSAA